jgi:hypothetical protein
MSFEYLASPYSHSDSRVMNERYQMTMKCAAWFLAGGTFVYSPIVHCHTMALVHDMPKDASFWMPYNYAMLERARSLIILTLDGWQDSRGIDLESEFARSHAIPLSFVHPSTFRRWSFSWTPPPSSSSSSSESASSQQSADK